MSQRGAAGAGSDSGSDPSWADVRILVAAAHPEAAEEVVSILESWGAAPTAVFDSEAAEQAVAARRPHVVAIDPSLPTPEVARLASALAALGENSNSVLWLGHPPPDSPLPGGGYLPVPVDPATLRQALTDAVAAARAEARPPSAGAPRPRAAGAPAHGEESDLAGAAGVSAADRRVGVESAGQPAVVDGFLVRGDEAAASPAAAGDEAARVAPPLADVAVPAQGTGPELHDTAPQVAVEAAALEEAAAAAAVEPGGSARYQPSGNGQTSSAPRPPAGAAVPDWRSRAVLTRAPAPRPAWLAPVAGLIGAAATLGLLALVVLYPGQQAGRADLTRPSAGTSAAVAGAPTFAAAASSAATPSPGDRAATNLDRATPVPAEPGAGALRGTVRRSDNARIVPGVTVLISGPSGMLQTVSDERGQYMFPELKQGAYTVVATAPNFQQQSSQVGVIGGHTSQNTIVLTPSSTSGPYSRWLLASLQQPPQPPGAIQGRLLDASNARPVAGARVVARGPSGFEVDTVSNEAGEFFLGDLPPGAYAVTATAAGYEPAADQTGVVSGVTTTDNKFLSPLPRPPSPPVAQRVPSPPRPPPAPAAARTYVVQPGDTLGVIAARFGTTVLDLMDLNQLASPEAIGPGQELRLPLPIARGK